MTEGKNPGGQPTKYKTEYCEMVTKHMSEGLSFESFAGVIGVNRDTLYEWAKVHQNFSDAKTKGTAASLLFWEKLGRQITIKGKGNIAGWIFNMKNRFIDTWKERHEVSSPEGQAPINIIIKERE